MRKVYHALAKESKTVREFIGRVNAYFDELGSNWQRPNKHSLYNFYRFNGY